MDENTLRSCDHMLYKGNMLRFEEIIFNYWASRELWRSLQSTPKRFLSPTALNAAVRRPDPSQTSILYSKILPADAPDPRYYFCLLLEWATPGRPQVFVTSAPSCCVASDNLVRSMSEGLVDTSHLALHQDSPFPNCKPGTIDPLQGFAMPFR